VRETSSTSRYEVRIEAATGELRVVASPEAVRGRAGYAHQQRYITLDSLGEGGWLKAMKLRVDVLDSSMAADL
jgi:hypothetical protein